jgi:hemerythrin-like domain-containing protein
MAENIEHHIEEEEGEMFSNARLLFDDDELEALGERMARRKETAREEMFGPARSVPR